MPRNSTEIGQRRTYSWRGRKLPSVTTLLKAWPMEWAIAYGAKAVAERVMSPEFTFRYQSEEEWDTLLPWIKKAPFEKRDAAAGAGTDLHAYLEGRLLGRHPEWAGQDMAYPTPAEDAIEEFLDAYRPDPLFVESQCFSISEGYAGTADAFLDIYGRRYVFDLKTSNSAAVDHKARLQLAAYRYADFIGEDDREIAPVPVCDGALVLVVPRDDPRSWQLIEVDAGTNEFHVFRAASRLWSFYDATKATSIGELVLPQLEEGHHDAA